MLTKALFTYVILLSSILSIAQVPIVKFSENAKAPSDITNFPRVIGSDESGTYTMQLFLKKSIMMTQKMMGLSMQLCRYDEQLKSKYEIVYNTADELESRTIDNVILLNNKLCVFASKFDKKEKNCELSATIIDKLSGKKTSSWYVLGNFDKEKTGDEFHHAVTLSPDSSCFILATSLVANNSHFQIKLLDTNFRAVGNIQFDYPANSYDLDAVVKSGNKIFIAGKEFEPANRKKKRVFKKVVLFNYNIDGKKENDIPVTKDGLYATSLNLFPFNDKILLAGFYTKSPEKNELNGLFTYTIDPTSGKIIEGDARELTSSMVGKTFDEEDDDDKKENRRVEKAIEAEDEDGFLEHYVFTKAILDPNSQSLILFAEYQRYIEQFSHASLGPDPLHGMTSDRRQFIYICGNIIAVKINATAKVSWANMLPKKQMEMIDIGKLNGGDFYSTPQLGQFSQVVAQLPFFSSFNCMQYGNQLGFVLNDHSGNISVSSVNDKAKKIINLYKSDCFYIKLDINTGKFTRRFLFSNNGEPTAMPRFGSLSNNKLYMPAFKFKFLDKPDCKLISIGLK